MRIVNSCIFQVSYWVFLLPTLLLILFSSCNNNPAENKGEITLSLPYDSLQLPDKPNILWLVAEDLSPYIAAFGDSTVHTPNLDRLASEGVRYPHLFSPSGVCAPSRAAIALGMYPTRTGAMHMRTGPWWNFYVEHQDSVWQNRRIYEAMPPEGTHMHSHHLRKDGYYTSNNSKEDYQFRAEMTAWDDSSPQAHWRNRNYANQPFFSIFNFNVTHESQIWSREDTPLEIADSVQITIPPYLPDSEVVRKDMLRMYSNIVLMDRQIGEILDQLEADGLLEKTIIFWYSDHGGPLPRSKRTLYDTGINAPLIVRFPNKQFAGAADSQLLSFVDLAPTLLSLAGIPIPNDLDGRAWLGADARKQPRAYVYAAADDFDGCCHDRVRAIRDHRFKLIKNYLPDRPYYLPVTYREQMSSMQELLRLDSMKKLDPYQGQWFRKTKDSIELFDLQTDPFELHNLAGKPEYQDKLMELHQQLLVWVEKTGDMGMISEADHLKRIWPNGKQPVTAIPLIRNEEQTLELTTDTPGASIGFQWLDPGSSPEKSWSIYKTPIPIQTGKALHVRAHRLGYKPSETAIYSPE